jgi:hypothetical protein
MLGGRKPSSGALRRAEARRIRHLDVSPSPAALPECTWTSSVPWAGLAFWVVALICLGVLAVDLISWGATGKQHWLNPDADPPDAVGWASIVFIVTMAAVVAAAVFPLLLQSPWMRLDSTDLTYRGRGFPRGRRADAGAGVDRPGGTHLYRVAGAASRR